MGKPDSDESGSEDEEPIQTNEQNTVDFLDIIAGVNFKVENHRKRLKYIENLDPATDCTKIVQVIRKAEVDIAAL